MVLRLFLIISIVWWGFGFLVYVSSGYYSNVVSIMIYLV